MTIRPWGLALIIMGCTLSLSAGEPQQGDRPADAQPKAMQAKAEPLQIPYRRTNTQHILVRVKINGKGPFNFILDTGAPIMILNTDIGQKLGLQTDANLFAKLDRVEIEGGAVLEKFPCRIETPFQLEGMNGMGMAGRELHGILGYTVLAKYRMEIDFTRDKMTWTPLNFNPPPPKGIGGKGGQGGLELLGKLMKIMGAFAGNKNPEVHTRGFIGVELQSEKDSVSIAAVLDKSPAADAGLKVGDQIEKINGTDVQSLDDFRRLTAEITAGKTVQLAIRRGNEKLEVKLVTGEGL